MKVKVPVSVCVCVPMVVESMATALLKSERGAAIAENASVDAKNC